MMGVLLFAFSLLLLLLLLLLLVVILLRRSRDGFRQGHETLSSNGSERGTHSV